jgi:hypothetical protein
VSTKDEASKVEEPAQPSIVPPKRKRGRALSRSRTTPEGLERWERAHEAVKLRRTGMLWDEIAKTLGFASRAGAYQAAMRFIREYPREDVEALRDLEAQRLDEAQEALWPAVKRGEVRPAEVWIKLSERRARMQGFDRPERREVTVITEDAVNAEIRRLNEEMERKAREARDRGIDLPEFAD